MPYDVRVIPFFKYDTTPDGQVANLDATVEKPAQHIRECRRKNEIDNPVFKHLPGAGRIATRGKVISRTERIVYDVADSETTQLGICTGDLADITGVHAWVNSENDQMRMARTIDRSVSSTIRYLGAVRRADGEVLRDQIVQNLASAVERATNARKGEQPRVNLGQVFQTGPSALQKSHGVRRIFHVAVVAGDDGKGFRPGPDITQYVENTIASIETYNQGNLAWGAQLCESALIPIFGTGQARGEPYAIVDQLIAGGIGGLRALATRNRPARLRAVSFLAFDTRALQALEHGFYKRVQSGDLFNRSGREAIELK